MKLDDALKCSATLIKLDTPENLSPVSASAYRKDCDAVGSKMVIFSLSGKFHVIIDRPFGEYWGVLPKEEMYLVIDKEDWVPYP